MATAVENRVVQLAAEIKDLHKKRGDVEFRLRGLEHKEKVQQGGPPVLGKRVRPGPGDRPLDNNATSKRFREGEGRRDDFRGRNDEGGRSFEKDRERGDDRGDNRDRSSTRLASVAVGAKKDLRDSRDSRDSRPSRDAHDHPRDSHSRDESDRSREESRRPKLSSTIGNTSSGTSDKRPTLDTNNLSDVRRSKNLFNRALMGTLKQFKSESDAKTEAEQRRLEKEQKIQQKVKEEQEKSIEEQKRAFQEQKEKELALKEEVQQLLEQKQLELLNLKWDHHREQLSQFLKTEAKPPIFYKLAKVEPKAVTNKEKSEEDTAQTNSAQDNQSQ